MNEEIDPETLQQVEGGNDWYGPCGCIETPFPPCELPGNPNPMI